MTVQLFEVGGCVRDSLLGLSSKDVDFTVVADGGWAEMKEFLHKAGFKVWLESPEFLTVRAMFPADFALASGTKTKGLTADFVLARKEGEYTDGRRPDLVTPGTLEDDLRRRDFTVNALARTEDGSLVDLFGGVSDLDARLLRCVGSAEERLTEDALRALRALRFVVTKGFHLDSELVSVLGSQSLADRLSTVSVERRREELLKAFRFDTLATLRLLSQFELLMEATFEDGLWLAPSLKGV